MNTRFKSPLRSYNSRMSDLAGNVEHSNPIRAVRIMLVTVYHVLLVQLRIAAQADLHLCLLRICFRYGRLRWEKLRSKIFHKNHFNSHNRPGFKEEPTLADNPVANADFQPAKKQTTGHERKSPKGNSLGKDKYAERKEN
jgi:hypothetical protein